MGEMMSVRILLEDIPGTSCGFPKGGDAEIYSCTANAILMLEELKQTSCVPEWEHVCMVPCDGPVFLLPIQCSHIHQLHIHCALKRIKCSLKIYE